MRALVGRARARGHARAPGRRQRARRARAAHQHARHRRAARGPGRAPRRRRVRPGRPGRPRGPPGAGRAGAFTAQSRAAQRVARDRRPAARRAGPRPLRGARAARRRTWPRSWAGRGRSSPSSATPAGRAPCGRPARACGPTNVTVVEADAATFADAERLRPRPARPALQRAGHAAHAPRPALARRRRPGSRALAALQDHLLEAARGHLRAGGSGVLVYSVVHDLGRGGAAAGSPDHWRTLPHLDATDGFYTARDGRA